MSPFPPGGENCARSLVPPFPGEPASPGVTMDWAKRHRGRIRWATAPPRPIGCFPRTPLRGTRTYKVVQNFRRAKIEWLSASSSGPLGPDFPKIEACAVPQLRLAFPNQRSRCWIRRRDGPMWPPAPLRQRSNQPNWRFFLGIQKEARRPGGETLWPKAILTVYLKK